MGESGGVSSVTIPGRFNGPPGSANGGYAAGVLAEASGLDPVTVQLRRPPPLERALEVVAAGGGAELRDGTGADAEVVAVARAEGPDAWTPVQPVDPATARSCEAAYPGHRAHPFPTCFSCGPDRGTGDGLRIFPGRVDAQRVAATWTPDTSVAGPDGRVGVPVTWAALDCVGGWSSDLEHRPMVLAEISARVESPPVAGTAYVLVGTLACNEGRKTWTASALLDPEGRLVARAEHLWIAVDWAVVQQLQSS
jgi:hypothetical protein